jgi:hypothetical protein
MKITSRRPVTVDAIVRDLLQSLSPEDLVFIASGQPDFGSVGRHIRNDYGLWDPAHPLTRTWHSSPAGRLIIDGVDHSPDHPDNVSGAIIQKLRSHLTP